MAKYIDAEKLKEEINNRLSANGAFDECGDEAWFEENCWREAYKSILSLIDSLQQEQPDVDLEVEIEMEWDSFNKHLTEYGEEEESVIWLNWHSFNDVARYFFNLRLKARKV